MCVTLRECAGVWKLLVPKPAEAGAEAVARGLNAAPGYDIAPGVQRKQDTPFSYLCEVEYVFGAQKGAPKGHGVVWGVVMHERKGVPWLAVGSKDGTGVELVPANAANVVPPDQRRLGGAWETETAYREALRRAAQAIDNLVVDVALRKRLAEKPEPVRAHLTKPELVEEALYHGYELMTPNECKEMEDKAEDWKEIAMSKQRELALQKASGKKEKRQREGGDAAETPRQAVARTPDQSNWALVENIDKKLDQILEAQHKDGKRIKKIKKEMKYRNRY
jgi:hypothetical protein